MNEFRASSVVSEYGTVSEVAFSSGMIRLEPQTLAEHSAQAMHNFSFEESVWVIGYKTEILDDKGRQPRENYLCHTFFGDQRVTQSDDQEMRGLYTDSFTPDVRLPNGFGVHLTAGDNFHWMPMFNNRADSPAAVRMSVRLMLIRQKDLKKPLAPLYATLRSVVVPHLYFVPPGGDTREATFKLDFDGRIHFLGTHVHPHGLRVDLYNVSRGELVWSGRRKTASPLSEMNVYSSTDGYPIKAGETYKVVAVYENPTSAPIDAMGGIYILYSRN